MQSVLKQAYSEITIHHSQHTKDNEVMCEVVQTDQEVWWCTVQVLERLLKEIEEVLLKNF